MLEPGSPELAPPRLGTGDSGDSSTQGEGDGPPHIGTDRPGGSDSGPPLIGDSKDFSQLQVKGRKVDDELHTAIKENTPDVQMAKLTDNYEERNVYQGLVLSNAKDLEEPFREIEVDLANAKYSSDSVFSKEGPVSKGVVAEGKFFDQDKTIIGENRFSGNDKNPKDKKMKSSDIVFAQWERFASHKIQNTGRLKGGMTDDVNKLENFIGRNILSKSTVENMNIAHKNTN